MIPRENVKHLERLEEAFDPLGNIVLGGPCASGKSVFMALFAEKMVGRYGKEGLRFVFLERDFTMARYREFVLEGTDPFKKDGTLGMEPYHTDRMNEVLDLLERETEERRRKGNHTYPIFVFYEDLSYGNTPSSREVYRKMASLMEVSRAVDIYFLIATQRPSMLSPEIIKAADRRIAFAYIILNPRDWEALCPEGYPERFRTYDDRTDFEVYGKLGE